jgi:hypothetical protein
MLLAEKELYDELDNAGIIDKRFPLWWTIGFEGRRYVKPEEFFGEFSDFEGSKFKLGSEYKDIKFTIVDHKLYGMDVPLFVTAKPLEEYAQERIKEWGLKNSFWLMAESYPHVRGIGMSLEDYALFWYPTKSRLGLEHDFHGIKLRDHAYYTRPESFFHMLRVYHMRNRKKTYYNINYSKDDCSVPRVPFVPFYEFGQQDNQATIVPSVHSTDKDPDLPTLIISQPPNQPVIKGFTDLADVYRIHRKIRDKVKDQVKERFGWNCEVYK